MLVVGEPLLSTRTNRAPSGTTSAGPSVGTSFASVRIISHNKLENILESYRRRYVSCKIRLTSFMSTIEVNSLCVVTVIFCGIFTLGPV